MGILKIKFSARNLPRMDVFSKSDPYLCVLMESSGGNFQVVAKTDWIKDNEDPDWEETLEIEDDCIYQNNKDLELRIEVIF